MTSIHIFPKTFIPKQTGLFSNKYKKVVEVIDFCL